MNNSIFISNGFFGRHLVACASDFTPLDFLYLPESRCLCSSMGYSPYLGRIFLCHIKDYIGTHESFNVTFADAKQAVVPNKKTKIVVWQDGVIKTADKIHSGQYAILQCVSHNVRAGKKPVFSTELRWLGYRQRFIINKKSSAGASKSKTSKAKWQQQTIAVEHRLIDKNQPVELLYQWQNNYKSVDLSVMLNDFLSVLQSLFLPMTTDLPDQFFYQLADAVIELANRSYTPLCAITVADASSAVQLRAVLRHRAPALASVVKPQYQFFAPFPAEIACIYESLQQQTIALQDGIKIHIDATKAGYMIDIDMAFQPLIVGSRSQAIFTANSRALTCIQNQLRWRNLAGLIFIDVINMEDKKQQHKLYNQLSSWPSSDFARLRIAPLSIFQVFELSRQQKGNVFLPMLESAFLMRSLDEALSRYFNLILQKKTNKITSSLYLDSKLWHYYCEFGEYISEKIAALRIEGFEVIEDKDKGKIIRAGDCYKIG